MFSDWYKDTSDTANGDGKVIIWSFLCSRNWWFPDPFLALSIYIYDFPLHILHAKFSQSNPFSTRHPTWGCEGVAASHIMCAAEKTLSASFASFPALTSRRRSKGLKNCRAKANYCACANLAAISAQCRLRSRWRHWRWQDEDDTRQICQSRGSIWWHKQQRIVDGFVYLS